MTGSFTADSPLAHITGEAKPVLVAATASPSTATTSNPTDPFLTSQSTTSTRATTVTTDKFDVQEEDSAGESLHQTAASEDEEAPNLVAESVTESDSSRDGSTDTDNTTEMDSKDDATELNATGYNVMGLATISIIEKEDEDNGNAVPKKGQQPKLSSIGVHVAAYELARDHAELFKSQIIDYVEEWHDVTTSRIKSRIIEFDRLKLNLEHYEKKLNALVENGGKATTRSSGGGTQSSSGSIGSTSTSSSGGGGLLSMLDDAVKASSGSIRRKKTDQLARNKLKLAGAREAHRIYGESLYLLIDEVVNRSWVDVFPVLLRSINFDVNQSQDIAAVYADSKVLANELEKLGVDNDSVSLQGRLKDLRDLHPEEIYTGTECMVRPVLKSK